MASLNCTITPISLILDDLVSAVDNARARCGDPAWLAALERAYEQLLLADAVRFDVAARALIVQSATKPARLYLATPRRCECMGYLKGVPCWHRAAAKVLGQAMAAKPAPSIAKPTPPAAPAVATGYDKALADLLACY